MPGSSMLRLIVGKLLFLLNNEEVLLLEGAFAYVLRTALWLVRVLHQWNFLLDQSLAHEVLLFGRALRWIYHFTKLLTINKI